MSSSAIETRSDGRRQGRFDTPEDLAEQMLAFFETHNQTATPFRWTYDGKVLGA